MSPNDNFKRELNNVFDEVSGAPSSQLRERVRTAVGDAPAQRSTYWIAAVAACVITALIVGILYVNNPFRRPTGLVNPGVTPSPAASPSVVPSPSPSPSPSPTTAFICTADTLTQSLPVGSPTAYVSAMRTAPQIGYDRYVIEFSNGIPTESVEVRPQTDTAFVLGGSGQTVHLKGKKGLEIRIHGADGHAAYHGKTDFVTGYSSMVEVRVVEDFEAVIRVGIGINGPACYRAFYLGNPARLVVDVQAAP